tara:strand:+ start:2522 stop:2806 length:285 start_codon:yes stop_codon:yes gene_type:complete
LEAELFELSRLQSSITGPDRRVDVETYIYAVLAQAIKLGQCVEFEYVKAEGNDPQWRRVIPYGIVQLPDKSDDPFNYVLGSRLKRRKQFENPHS